MNDQGKTNAELLEEISTLKKRIQEPEQSESDRKQAEENLKKREKTIQAFFDAVHESMVLIDTKGTILLSNVVGAQRLGKTVPEFVGTCLYDWFPPDVARYRKEQYEKVVDTGEPVYFQDTRLGRFFEQYCSPVFDEKRNVSGVTIFAHDITERKRAEDALRTSEQKYRNIFENVVEGIFLTTPDGRFLTVNSVLARIYGYSSPEEIIETVTDIGRQVYVNPDERDEFLHIIQEKGVVTGFELQLRKKDGSTFWASINARSVYDENGQLLYYEGTTEDITQRKQAEIALLESRDKLAVIAEGSAIPQFAIDKDHTVILWNRALEIYSGAKAKDVLGTSNHWKAFYPEKRPCLVDLVIESVTEDEIARWYGNIYSRSDLLDGAYEAIGYFPLMKEGAWLHFTAAVIKDSSGNTIAGIETLEDITGLRATEVLLRQAEQKYRSIFENATEGIFQTSLEGRFISVNPSLAHMHGYDSPEDLINSITDMAHQLYVNPEDRERLKRILTEQGSAKGFEVELYRKDKSKFWLSINVHAVRGPDGVTLYLEGTNEDITQRKQAEEKLRHERQRFAILTENAPFGMTMIDKDGNFVYINPKFKVIFGYDLSEIPDGKTWFTKAYPDPAYRQTVIAAWVEDLKAAGPGEQRPRIFTVICKDGTEKIINFIPVQVETGVHIMTCEDITERKKSEEMLLQSKENYRSITDNALNGIYQTTKDGKFLMANPAFFSMLGYASFEEMAASITDITHEFYVNPEDRQYVKRILEKEDTIRKFETQFYKKDRSKMWVSINMRNVRDADGTFLYYEGIDEDITFRKQAEEDLKQTTEKLRKSLAGTIQAMSLTVETRDPYTAGHQRKVSSLARTIAQEMGLSKDAVENIRMAGIIHDIGKISVPAEILVKPGKISDIEMSLIKVHPQSGYDILKDVELPYPIAEIVLQHHERLDGSGYPQGLKGDQILLEAKIVSVADVVEAIASHRPYRPAKGIEAAFEEIERNKGTLYDAETVEVCLKLFREKGFSFEPTES